ncbi:MAG: peptide/nickel transport system permease protein [Solirubrobacterales bacterium]|nr:peptide/nickel transport system permease protein [Solirubrobacterales bacterium]
MAALIARRIAALAAILLGLATIVFVLQVIIPADPARAIVGASASPAVVAAKTHELGYDRPLPQRYVAFLGRLAQGDLQESLRSRRAVTSDLGDFGPATLELAASAGAIALALGLVLGIALAGGTRGSGVARLLLVGGASLPVFVLAFGGILLLYSRFGILPASGRVSDTLDAPRGPTHFLLLDSLLAGRLNVFGDALRHLVLPATALALGPALALARTLRASLDRVMQEDHVRTARAKGLRERTVLVRHALRNSLGPMLTMAGLQFGLMLGGVIVVEEIFAWPGIGLYMAQAITYADFPAIAGVTLALGTVYVLVNFLVDLAQSWADPRIRV